MDADALYAQSKKPLVWLGLSLAGLALIFCFGWGRRMMAMFTAPLWNRQLKYDDGGDFDKRGWFYQVGYIFPDGAEPANHLLHVRSIAQGSYKDELELLERELQVEKIHPIIAQYCARLISLSVTTSAITSTLISDERELQVQMRSGYATVQRDNSYLKLLDKLETSEAGNMLYPLVRAQVLHDLGNLDGASQFIDAALKLQRFTEPSTLITLTANREGESLTTPDRLYICLTPVESVTFRQFARAVSAYESDLGIRVRAKLFRALARVSMHATGYSVSRSILVSQLTLCSGISNSRSNNMPSGVERCIEFQQRVGDQAMDSDTNYIRFYGYGIASRRNQDSSEIDREFALQERLETGYGIVFGLIALTVLSVCLLFLTLTPAAVFPRIALPLVAALLGSVGVAYSSGPSIQTEPLLRFGPSCAWAVLITLSLFSNLRKAAWLMGSLFSIAALVTAFSYFAADDPNFTFLPILFVLSVVRYLWISNTGPSKSLVWPFLGVTAVFLFVSSGAGDLFVNLSEAIETALFAGGVFLVVMLILSCAVSATAKQMLKVVPFGLFVAISALGWMCWTADEELTAVFDDNARDLITWSNPDPRLLTAAYGENYSEVLEIEEPIKKQRDRLHPRPIHRGSENV